MDSDIIIGTCLEMCPVAERDLREKEGLMHRFECYETKIKSQRKADPLKTIKCFSRSAAGTSAPRPENLRPAPVLLDTVRYLMRNFASCNKQSEQNQLVAYEFITDRLRAVRQDMTIQRLSPDSCIPILEPMIRFYVLYGFILSTNSKFDDYLNNIQLQECLAKVIDCYEMTSDSTHVHREQIENIFACVNVNKPEIVIKRIKISNISMKLLIAWTVNNFVRLLDVASNLDLVCQAALSSKMPNLRVRALGTMCQAMSAANSTYPVDSLQYLLSYNCLNDVIEDCYRLGIKTDKSHCHFNKKDLIASTPEAAAQRWWVVDNALSSADWATLLLEVQ